ncbi:MAG: hypothetical protein JSV06_08455, partial [Myxococcales bacterium]
MPVRQLEMPSSKRRRPYSELHRDARRARVPSSARGDWSSKGIYTRKGTHMIHVMGFVPFFAFGRRRVAIELP